MNHQKLSLQDARRIAEACDIRGGPGGWIYNRSNEPICQGWFRFTHEHAPGILARGVERGVKALHAPLDES